MNTMREKFYANLKNHGIELSDLQKQQFESYAQLLVEWNQKMNLTAIVEEDAIYEKHFLDSIMVSYDIPLFGSFCDVGSGAGFPSIPLKIVYPELDICIVEPLKKRCVFLQELIQCLKLKDVKIVNERAEDFAVAHRESFDFVCARAVANLTMLAELCIPLVKVNGAFVAMKGPQAQVEYEDAKHAIDVLGCSLEGMFEDSLHEMKRFHLCFRKVKKTPKQYPRMFAKIKKSPLKG